MNPADQHRIAKRHLDRNAIVYVRQSDARQVRENTESTLLQRGLRERAIEMGWLMPKLVEDDLGISASGFAERPGFQWMLTQVTLRKVGIIFCIEASRLSRNSSDWAQLFELCGYFDTLVADEQKLRRFRGGKAREADQANDVLRRVEGMYKGPSRGVHLLAALSREPGQAGRSETAVDDG